MDKLDSMRVFAEVVRAGSFSRAALRLGMSKALASKHVGRLEQRLGVRLLNRTTRRLNTTEVGRAYYDRCVEILGDLDQLEETVAAEHAAPRGTLRVSGPRAYGEDRLVGSVAAFMATYPEVMLDLVLDERLVDIVGEGFDVAIRIGELAESSMIARRIADYPYLLCASADYVARAGAPRKPEDLAGHPCIVNTAISPGGQWQFSVGGRRTAVTLRPRARVNTARAAATLVREGLGIGLCLHSSVSADLESGRLVRLLRSYEAYDRSVYAVYPHRRQLSAKVRAFIDHLASGG